MPSMDILTCGENETCLGKGRAAALGLVSVTHSIETSTTSGNSDVRGLSTLDIVVFCILAGVVSTFASGYTYGQINQVEHLPMMFRMVDPEYLRGDFFVDSTTEFNPRFYYIALMAILAQVVSPPVLFLLLTCVANALIAGVTWYAARNLSVRSDWVPILACTLVMSVSAFNLGGAAHLTRPFLDQSLLSRPFAMLGLWLTITGSLRSAALLFAIAMVIHPLVGMETAAVALAAAAMDAGLTLWRGESDWSEAWGRLRRLTSVALVLAFAGYLMYYDLYHDAAHTLDTERFIHILAETRAPHHFLPSQFGAGSYLAFGVFCWAALWSWHRWRPTDQTGTARSILAVGAIVGSACLGGYVFVEVVPTRLGVTAHTFRLVYLIKWLGLLMLAAVAGQALTRSRPLATRVGDALLVLGVGRFQPAVALLGHVSTLAGRRFRGRWATTAVSVCAAAAGGALVVAPAANVAEEPLALGLLLGIGSCLLLIRSSWRRWLPAGVVTVGVALLIYGRTSPVAAVWVGAVGVQLPQVTLDDSRHDWSPAARFAREHTEIDAIFVIPPVGGFRLEARRAVVVDFKVVSFGDAHLSEWYERMQLTYEGSLTGPLSALPVLHDKYAGISDDRLLALKRRYGATHALLFKQTRSRMPVLYEDDRYKLTRIDRPVAQRRFGDLGLAPVLGPGVPSPARLAMPSDHEQ